MMSYIMSGLGEIVGKLLCAGKRFYCYGSIDHCTRAAELKPATLYGHCRLKFPASTPPREYHIMPVS